MIIKMLFFFFQPKSEVISFGFGKNGQFDVIGVQGDKAFDSLVGGIRARPHNIFSFGTKGTVTRNLLRWQRADSFLQDYRDNPKP